MLIILSRVGCLRLVRDLGIRILMKRMWLGMLLDDGYVLALLIRMVFGVLYLFVFFLSLCVFRFAMDALSFCCS